MLSKKDLIDVVSDRTGHKKKDVDLVLTTLIDEMIDALSTGEEIKLSKFGTFKVATTKAHSGVNPSTREPMTVPEKKRIAFKVSTTLKDAIN